MESRHAHASMHMHRTFGAASISSDRQIGAQSNTCSIYGKALGRTQSSFMYQYPPVLQGCFFWVFFGGVFFNSEIHKRRRWERKSGFWRWSA
ncbi:uncharacterized protein BDZ99DRAFT_170703 [Mytilinidion resinicola]|uniref:Uncharacterized protein n=1 Tax=Mytilinidion resinicola TaxID=574789 RepID=A0A6A6Y5L5_9PEZI|nr:uncharacterized protein BDZ99DRAFT_170703 [Mytilinidion resinicola]KAF2803314.1 hypothetical protein BDZ99DRAFT_170703 [Mytilinidion resinicola]